MEIVHIHCVCLDVHKKTIVALEQNILANAYHLIQRNEPYRELGGNYFDNRRPEATAKRFVKRREQLGYAWLSPDRRIERNLG